MKSPPSRRPVARLAATLLGGCLAAMPAVRAAEPLPPDAIQRGPREPVGG